jgi:hypothetical protein
MPYVPQGIANYGGRVPDKTGVVKTYLPNNYGGRVSYGVSAVKTFIPEPSPNTKTFIY